MKRLCKVLLLFIVVTSFSNSAFADPTSANRQTTFNNVTDYFATLGETPADKKKILWERRKMRRKERLTKESLKRKKLMKAKMKAQENLIMRKVQAGQN